MADGALLPGFRLLEPLAEKIDRPVCEKLDMINAVLMDLDNTMVLFDEAVYVERYFQRLTPRFSDLFDDDDLRRRVFGATMALRQNRGAHINRDFFLSRFCDGSVADRHDIWNRFMQFYENDYCGVRPPVGVPDGLDTVLERLSRSGRKLVLASNPVFPSVAQQIRMSWAGIPANLFDMQTHIDNMWFVKPDAGYYRQICDMLREPPSACLMVGNDPQADMAAKLAGIRTYRTTDAERAGFTSFSLTPTKSMMVPPAPFPDHTGPLSGVLHIIDNEDRACGAVIGLS